MKPVICFGEALIDFLNTGNEQDGCLSLNNFRQYPGGAPANAAVAVAKLGGKALFAGQVGNDVFGHFLESSLQAYAVDTQYLSKHPSASTALAFVTLDQYGERTFSFYRNNSADMLFSSDQVSQQWFATPSIFHFCSNTLTEAAIAKSTEFAVNQAIKANAIISFDVNLRHNLWPTQQADIDTVNKLICSAHVIKFSRDEFEYLANTDANGSTDDYLAFCFNSNCQLVIITDGAKPIQVHSRQGAFQVQPPAITAIDTTAGGDGFIGGFLYGLSKFNNLNLLVDNTSTLTSVIKFAAQCGAIAVSKSGAFPALATIDQVLPSSFSQNQAPSLEFFLEQINEFL